MMKELSFSLDEAVRYLPDAIRWVSVLNREAAGGAAAPGPA